MIRNFFKNFYYRKYRINFVVVRPFRFEGYPFHLIRGIFGKILHNAVCTHKEMKDCARCPLNDSCPYTDIFKVKLKASHPLYGKYTEPPVPYILFPETGGKTTFTRGNSFAIELTLIGKAIEYDTFLLQVVQQLSEGEGLLYHKLECSGIETMIGEDKKSHLRFSGLTSGATQLKLSFNSPLILESKQNLVESLPFDLLIERLTERAALLNYLYCDGVIPDLNSFHTKIPVEAYIDSFYKEMVEVDRKNEKRVIKPALLGSVAYKGAFNEYLPLIQAGEILHFGRLTNYGLGKYTVDKFVDFQ